MKNIPHSRPRITLLIDTKRFVGQDEGISISNMCYILLFIKYNLYLTRQCFSSILSVYTAYIILT
jgi:hypothetical protein